MTPLCVWILCLHAHPHCNARYLCKIPERLPRNIEISKRTNQSQTYAIWKQASTVLLYFTQYLDPSKYSYTVAIFLYMTKSRDTMQLRFTAYIFPSLQYSKHILVEKFCLTICWHAKLERVRHEFNR